jgi:hypothetical protein
MIISGNRKVLGWKEENCNNDDWNGGGKQKYFLLYIEILIDIDFIIAIVIAFEIGLIQSELSGNRRIRL